jgi:hypothetical protein
VQSTRGGGGVRLVLRGTLESSTSVDLCTHVYILVMVVRMTSGLMEGWGGVGTLRTATGMGHGTLFALNSCCLCGNRSVTLPPLLAA